MASFYVSHRETTDRRKDAYGAMCAHVPIVSALHVGISNQASCTSTPHMSAPFGRTKAGLRRHVRSRPDYASRPSVPFAVTSRLFALFVSHIRNEEIDTMHTYVGNKSSAKCTLTSDG
ncbi:hypothetical protein Bbelb_391190 [Branchiostoma belcheri]|nr:hypothetical protein Bbelb_391190 [Branchiostoma belcheri]